jgi:hypothetical protein
VRLCVRRILGRGTVALSNAERQRRYRERKRAERAEQQKLDPVKSAAPAKPRPAAVTVTAVTDDVPRLGERGARLWRELGGDNLDPAKKVLAEEACRIADRLDRLDDFLRGREDAWLRFRARNEDGSIVQVVVDKALAEARQQAVALKQIVAELRQGGKDKPETGGSVLDQLAARRAARLANTTG